MKSTLLIASVLALACPALAAGSSVKDPVTFMGEHMLAKADLVALGEIGASTLFPSGARLVRMTVTEVLVGRETTKTVLLVAGSPDLIPPKRTSAVLFLKRLGRARYEPVGRVDAFGVDAKARIATLRRYLEIEAMTDAVEKRKVLREYLLTNLESSDRFLIWSAARELANFSRRNKKFLDEKHRARMRRVRSQQTDPLLEGLLQTALTNAGDAPKPPKKDEVGKGPTGPEFRELRLLIKRWKKKPPGAEDRFDVLTRITGQWLKFAAAVLRDALDDESATIREHAAFQIGEGEFSNAEPALRQRLRVERDRAVLSALIHSLGLLESEKALPAILALGKSEDLRRPAAYAAVRIGGKLADDWLDALVAKYSRETTVDREIRRFVAFLRSEAFAKQEKALKEIRRKRLQ